VGTTTFDLSRLPWTLRGWHPNFWRAQVSMETGMALPSETRSLGCQIPCSVQRVLRDAGELPDWNVALQSRGCEWVENRHWSFETDLPAAWAATPGAKRLCFDGLDGTGVVLLNRREIGSFANAFRPHEFDVTALLQPGDNRLAVVFTEQPRYLGQVAFTSQIRDWKPRFNYVWDWTPRLVQIGIWDAVRLEVQEAACLRSLRVQATYDPASGTGNVHASARHDGAGLRLSVIDEGRIIASGDGDVLSGFSIEPWQPNLSGSQRLYTVRAEVIDAAGHTTDARQLRVGFKHVTWKPCRNAPAGALPWVCCINGTDTFLQGVNWTPIRPNFADVTEADYRLRLATYRDMGVNVLRVWGGACLEKEVFYTLCDEMGLLVWQEFPFSSSGLENWAPEDPAVIDEAVRIAETYVARRQHHASLLLWCGGNELQGGMDGSKSGVGIPIPADHPMSVALRAVVERVDPGRRFLEASSSGPRFGADPADFGKGLHHDVHGPWNEPAPGWWMDYWPKDDALFRSEAGMTGASPVDLLNYYAGELSVLPGNAENPLWRHVSHWWIQWKDYLATGGAADDLDAFVAWSQQLQAEHLAYAATQTKRRFPACGGFIVWMGHDSFPCPSNTAVLDFHGRTKPAAVSLRAVFRAATDELGER
jgi:beta-mannosidase